MNIVGVVVLATVAGFAATIWAVLTVSSLRLHRRWDGLWFACLAAATLFAVAILIGRVFGRPAAPPVVSILILVPIIGIPPFLMFRGWLKTRTLVR